MFRTDIPGALAGFISYAKYTFTFADLTAAATTQTITLQEQPGYQPAVTLNFNIPQAGKMLGNCIHHTTSFTGGGVTAMTVSIGNTAGGATYYAPAFNVFQAVADTTLQETGGLFKAGQISAQTVTVTFTSTSANVSAATAGSVDIYLFFLNVSMPVYQNVTPTLGSIISQP